MLITVLTALFIPLHKAYEEKIAALQTEVVDKLESFLGFHFEYGSIFPSFLKYIEIRNLRVLSGPEGKTELLYLNRIRVYYRIGKLIKGKTAEAFYRISLDNSRLEFDPRRDAEVFTLLNRIFAKEEAGLASPEKPREDLVQSLYPILGMPISGRNLTLVYRDAWGDAEISRLFFSFQPEGDYYKFSLRGEGRFALPETLVFHRGGGDLRINGRIGTGLDWGEILFTLKGWKTNLADFSRLSFQGQFQGQQITIRKIQDRVPFDLTVKLNTAAEKANFSFSAENFIPDNHIQVRRPLEKLAFLSSVGLTGTATGAMTLASQTISYATDMKLSIPINPWIPTPMTMEVKLEGEGPLLSIERLDITSSKGLLFFSGKTDLSQKVPFPTGTLKLSEIDLPQGSLSAMLYLRSRNGENLAFAPWVRYKNLPFKNWDMRFSGDFGGFDFVTTLSYDEVDWENRFEARGSLSLGKTPFLQGELITRHFPLGVLGAAMTENEGIQGFSQKLPEIVLSSRCFLSSNLDRFSFSFADFFLNQRGRKGNSLTASFSGNNTSLTISSLQGRYSGFDFGLTGMASFESGVPAEWETTLEVEGKIYELTGKMEVGEFLQIHGNYGLESLITFGQGYSFKVLAKGLPLPVREGVALNLDARGRYKNSAEWVFLLREAAIDGLPAVVGNFRGNRLILGGQASPRAIFLSRIDYSDSLSSLLGNGEILLSPREKTSSGWFQLSEATGNEQHLFTFDYDGENLLGNLNVQNLPLERLGTLPLKGKIDGEAVFAGPWEYPDLTISLNLEEGFYNETPVAFSSEMAFDGMTISLKELSASYLNQGFTVKSGFLNLASGEAVAEGDFRGILQENPLVGGFSLSLNGAPLRSRRDLFKVTDQDFQGILKVEELRIFNETKSPWIVMVSQTDGKLNFQGGPGDSLSLNLERNGRFLLSLTRALPLSFKAEGILSSGKIEAQCRDIFMNFEAINRVFAIPYFTITAGQAEGDLRISGSVNDPDLYGRLLLTKAKAKVINIDEILSLDTALIQADQKTFTAKDVILTSAGGSAIMNCEFTLDHLLPYDYTIAIETLYNKDPYLTMSFPKVSVDGYVKGLVQLTGSTEFLKVTGALEVYSGTLALNPGDEVPETKKVGIITDLTIKLKQNNQFYWPSKPFPILKAYAEGGEELVLKINTIENTLSLLGEVDIRGGEIFYFQRNFYLEDGRITFNETKERFDPVMNAKAALREIDTQGEIVKIYLIAENMTLTNFNPRFESEPYRQESEILAMLGQNLFDTTEGTQLLGDALLITSDVVGQFGFIQGIQNALRELLRLDLLSLRTQVLSNLLVNRLLNNGNNSLGADDSLSTYLDNTTLILGKYFGQDFFLQALVQMDYYGNQASQVYPNSVFNIDAEVSLEWKSPLALIQFNLYPNFFDKDKDPLSTSLGLSWSFSF